VEAKSKVGEQGAEFEGNVVDDNSTDEQSNLRKITRSMAENRGLDQRGHLKEGERSSESGGTVTTREGTREERAR